MPSPFPGMDPYLENKALWPDFHNVFASAISTELNRTLPPLYFAKTDVRYETEIFTDVEPLPGRRQRVEGVGVTREPEGGGGTVAVEARREISESIFVRVPNDPLRAAYVEIYHVSGPSLVTVIEIVSPANKSPGLNRESYRQKQEEILNSYANLVEIDLLRGGKRLLPSPLIALEVGRIQPPPTYLVMVSEAKWRDAASLGYSLYPVGLRDPLPCVGIPLKPEEPLIPLDLQNVFNRVYDNGPYRRGALNYEQPLAIPLSEEEAIWAKSLIPAR